MFTIKKLQEGSRSMRKNLFFYTEKMELTQKVKSQAAIIYVTTAALLLLPECWSQLNTATDY
jgi:hypothetical protein